MLTRWSITMKHQPTVRSIILTCITAGACLTPLCFTQAEKPQTLPAKAESPAAAEDMVAAANTFLAALDPDQKAKASFTMEDTERLNWRFVPIERKGITLEEMRPEQDHLAMALLGSIMSSDGIRKSATIMSLERILWELENHAAKRNPENYHILIFGQPTMDGQWGWRFEGHHFSCNVTLSGGRLVSMTPSFMGANPGIVLDGPRKGLQLLGEEENAGRALAKTLTDEQKKDALLAGDPPADVLTAEKQRVEPLAPAGLSSAKLTEAQRGLLWKVIGTYIGRFRPELADTVAVRLRSTGQDSLTFAWSGGMEPGNAHYYRVQSPDFLFEYDNTQNNANHPHAVWRDFEGDFGIDILKQHLKETDGK